MSQLMNYPLHGVHLIDASAGTGKTYTIAGLFVRLLLEREFSIGQILVVTYTKAATEDLRVRVRQKIQHCLRAFESGHGLDDFEKNILQKVIDHGQACRRLTDSLQNFDEAAIFTIHGFCQRMLRENSLESGALADAELLPDLDDLLLEICADFWRIRTAKLPPLFLSLARDRFQPEKIFSFVKQIQPGRQILPPVTRKELDSIVVDQLARLGNEVQEALSSLYEIWPAARPEVIRLLLENEVLNKNSYKPDNMRLWLVEMDDFCRERASYQGKLFDAFNKFTSENLTKATRKNCPTPAHPFFDLCGQVFSGHSLLLELVERCLIGLWHAAADYALQEFDRRKQERNVFTYDDLLQRLQKVLQGPTGERVVELAGARFPAALIDEFQDTDPVQYEIFSTLYRGAGQNLLYIIGDPKQAIYSFRGADIFAYLKAIRDVNSSYTLGINYRSVPLLIKAVNTLFADVETPFFYDDIVFTPVGAADTPGKESLTFSGQGQTPFHLCLINRHAAEGKPLLKPEAEKRILTPLANEIRRLLDQGDKQEALIGERALGARDIAVLVRTNREGKLVQQYLAAAGVASVVQSADDLFASDEAVQLLRVLQALALPESEQAMRTALTTDLFALSCDSLAGLDENEEVLSSLLDEFWQYHVCWRYKGFMAMFTNMLEKRKMREQLLCFDDGERRLTNILHLGEVLHQYEYREKASLFTLLSWFAGKIANRGKEVEDYQLRLESDAKRVRIVTIHRAKGLQYPVVFCPFSWTGLRRQQGAVAFHLQDEQHTPALDLGSEKEKLHKEWAREEEQAENVRLLYVALTRAIHRCYVFWGNFRGAESSALARLLHGCADVAGMKRFVGLTDGEIAEELEELAGRSGGAIALHRIDEEDIVFGSRPVGSDDGLVCSVFLGSLVPMQVTSFSAITAVVAREGEKKIHRELKEPGPDDTLSVFAFPRGAAPGTFMHDIFENLDFGQIIHDPQTCRDLIEEKLVRHRFDQKWREGIFSMVKNVLTTPLSMDIDAPVLQDITLERRLNELEFYFPLSAVKAGTVKAALAKWGLEYGADVDFSVGKGFLKGFIDLVFEHKGRFYVLDWKSNYLGPQLSDYRGDVLNEVMVREKYVLQYLVYTVALHHYLAQRMSTYSYEKHFGGVFYVFLRGVNPGKGPKYGIFHDLPDAGLVERLSEILVERL